MFSNQRAKDWKGASKRGRGIPGPGGNLKKRRGRQVRKFTGLFERQDFPAGNKQTVTKKDRRKMKKKKRREKSKEGFMPPERR